MKKTMGSLVIVAWLLVLMPRLAISQTPPQPRPDVASTNTSSTVPQPQTRPRRVHPVTVRDLIPSATAQRRQMKSITPLRHQVSSEPHIASTVPQPQTRPRRVQLATALHPTDHARQTVNETKPPGERSSIPAESPSPQIGPPPATKSQEVLSTPRPWSFYMVLSSVFDTNINHDEENLQAFGLVAGAGFHYQNHPTRPTFEFNYEVARHAYTATDQWDRTSHNLRASWERKLGRRWEMETSGEIGLKGSTEDRELADRYMLEQEFQFRLSKQNRLNFGGALRLKRYDDNPGRNAFNPYVEGGFEQRLGGGRKWEIGYRYETNRSQNERFKYIRWTYSAEFTTPLMRQGWLTVEAKYRPQKYARLVEIELEDGDDIEVPRRDQRWILGAEWRFPLWRNLELGANYKFETRSSNDPDKKFNAHLMGVSLMYRW